MPTKKINPDSVEGSGFNATTDMLRARDTYYVTRTYGTTSETVSAVNIDGTNQTFTGVALSEGAIAVKNAIDTELLASGFVEPQTKVVIDTTAGTVEVWITSDYTVTTVTIGGTARTVTKL